MKEREREEKKEEKAFVDSLLDHLLDFKIYVLRGSFGVSSDGSC